MQQLKHDCEGVILTCIDFRLWERAAVLEQIKQKAGISSFDVVSLSGGTRNLVDEKTRELILSQIEISTRLHHSTTVVLTNHTTCGAYGESGTRERLIEDLQLAASIISERFPQLEVCLLLVDITASDVWEINSEALEVPVA